MGLDTILFLTVMTFVAGVITGLLVASRRLRGSPTGDSLREVADQAVLKEGLARLSDQMFDLERQRVSWQSQLNEQVRTMLGSADSLRQETAALSTALRKPQVRGQWGELQLRRTVELAGLVNHCDFTEQGSVPTPDGTLRPDVIVHLAGGRHVVVDAKVPLEGFLTANQCVDQPERHHEHLARHGQQMRAHIDSLSSKRYWQAVGNSPEFVVLFVPAEAFLSAALEVQTDLIEYAAAKQVLLATPTTLIALLRTVAHGWRHENLNAQAHQIHELGLTLYRRLGKLSTHFDQLGRALDNAVLSYNQAVGSYQHRVLVAARKFEEVVPPSELIEDPRNVGAHVRSLDLEASRRRAAEPGAEHGLTLFSSPVDPVRDQAT